jgi:hypothetical protein
VRALKERFGVRLFEATGGGGSVQLLTDGSEIYARTAGGSFFNLLKTPSQPMLVLGDEGTLKQLGGKLRGKSRGKPRHRIGNTFSRSSAGRGMT